MNAPIQTEIHTVPPPKSQIGTQAPLSPVPGNVNPSNPATGPTLSAGGGIAMPAPLLVDIPTAAAMLGISPKTCLRQLGNGRLRGFKIGRCWRIRVAELADYVRRLERNFKK